MHAQLRKLVLNISVLGAYALIGGVSLLLALAFAISLGMDRFAVTREADRLAEVVELSQLGGALAHELQKERGMSAVFIASKGANFGAELENQRRETDAKLSGFVESAAQIEAGSALHKTAGFVLEDLETLAPLRKDVQSLSIDADALLGRYSAIVEELITLYDVDVSLDLVTELSNVGTFLRAKEAGGLERALGARALNSGGFGTKGLVGYVNQVAAQDIHLARFEQTSGPIGQTIVSRLFGSAENQSLETMRTALLAQSFDRFTGSAFFAASTARLELLYGFEQELVAALSARLDEISTTAKRDLYLTFLVCATAIVIVGGTMIAFAGIQSSVMREVVEASKKMISGDLDAKLPKAGQNDLSQIIRTLAMFRDETRAIREDQKAKMEQEKAALQSLRERALEANKRAQRIAEDLEHTAASTEELAASVSSSATSTSQADSHAKHMLARAREGRAVVESAVDAMTRISAVAGQIKSIVAIIDEIAFQTNLLALNARVEAARAGVAGRGFAVVASEVQQLASRSAKAAADVSTLIAESGIEIENGVEIVQNSGEMLSGIAQSAVEMAEIIRYLTDISAQQNQAVATINSATSRLDQEMQSLASMAA